MYMIIRKESGFTLVELMIGLVVGLLVLGGVLSVYITTIRTSSSTLNSSRLNQEMAAIMSVMVSDIRRAGYWNGGITTSPLNNPFSQAGSTALEVQAIDAGTGSYVDQGPKGSGTCIVYAYDLDNDGVLDDEAAAPADEADEGFGFRWDDAAGQVIKMRRGHTTVNDCNDAGGSWNTNPLTDATFINIENLNFSLTDSTCLNTSEPNGIVETTGADGTDLYAERDCYDATYPPDTGEVTVEVRQVEITLTASLVDEPSVRNTMRQSVEVRNNHIQEH